MHIVITGGTGLIGRALCRFWGQQGHRVWVISRRPEQVAKLCGDSVQAVRDWDALAEVSLDAVVNLAGAPIADWLWTKSRKSVLWESRVQYTEHLVAQLAKRVQKPGVLISGSAMGWYGDGGEHPLTEEHPSGSDFASQLCVAWEDAATQATDLGIRVVLIRTGLVLSRSGGFLPRMLPAFRWGLGGPLGRGRHWMPWIHEADQVRLMDFLLHQPALSGPFNACAPHPVRNQVFAKTLGAVLRRTAFLPMPASFLRLVLGELSGLLLSGQQAVPRRALDAGFSFQFEELAPALHALLDAP